MLLRLSPAGTFAQTTSGPNVKVSILHLHPGVHSPTCPSAAFLPLLLSVSSLLCLSVSVLEKKKKNRPGQSTQCSSFFPSQTNTKTNTEKRRHKTHRKQPGAAEGLCSFPPFLSAWSSSRRIKQDVVFVTGPSRVLDQEAQESASEEGMHQLPSRQDLLQCHSSLRSLFSSWTRGKLS